MSDTQNTRNTDHDAPAEHAALLKDLRAMPRISAPLDFQEHLRRRIEETEAVLPWWKRFFAWRPGWGFGVPGYAYGAIAAAFVAVVAVYVFNTTNFEQELRRESERIPAEPSQEILHEEITIPDESVKDADAMRQEPRSRKPARRTRSAPAAKTAISAESAPTPASEPPTGIGRSYHETTPRESRETNFFAPALRGILKDETPPAIPDSIAKKDSVRAADSLSKQIKDKLSKPTNDAR